MRTLFRTTLLTSIVTLLASAVLAGGDDKKIDLKVGDSGTCGSSSRSDSGPAGFMLCADVGLIASATRC